MNANKKLVQLTESKLKRIIAEAIQEALEEDDLEEGKWLNRASGLALGAASLFGGYNSANAQHMHQTNNIQNYEQTTQMSEKQAFDYINSWVNNHLGNGILSHEQIQEEIFDNFDTSDIGKDKNLDYFLYKHNGKYITPDNCNAEDVMYILQNTEKKIKGNPAVTVFYIGDTEYFVNLGGFHYVNGW